VLIRTRIPGEEVLPAKVLTNGWGGLFKRGFAVVHTAGDHLSVVADSGNAAELAKQINAVLDQVDVNRSSVK
jgi:hypothetical protein